MDYVELPTLEDVLRDAAKKKEKNLIWKLWDTLFQQIEMASDAANERNCIFYALELDKYREYNGYGKILQKGYLDMIPRNCFVNSGQFFWYDQEWMMDNIPSKFILLRGMRFTYDRVEELAELISKEEFVERYGLYDCLKVMDGFNDLFESTVQDMNRLEYFIGTGSGEVYRNNVGKLMT